MKKLLFFLLLFASCSLAFSQSTAEKSKESLQRAISICPEVAKLTEVIALARDIGHDILWTSNTIHASILPEQNEAILIQDLINFVYEHPEMLPYEHLKNTEPACYEAFGVTSEQIRDARKHP
ncbi:MAG: hypothetical protein ACRCWR_01845 [Saezia sp.]